MLNRVILMGRLTANPELKKTPTEISVTSFTLAVARTFDRETTDFINVIAWRQTAEFVANYFEKGMQVAVSGRLQVRSYDDRNGAKRKVVEVVADEVFFADTKRESEATANDDSEDLPLGW